jgi:competence protein ComEA
METTVRVNLNTAKEEELAQVPGIGPVLAKRIVAAQPFASFEDMRRVPGIGTSTLAACRRARLVLKKPGF